MSNLNTPDDDTRLSKWLKGHVIRTDDIVVFADAGPPAQYPDNLVYWQAEIDVPISPGILQFRGDVDLKDFFGGFNSYLKIPLCTATLLSTMDGDLHKGIKSKLEGPMITGEFTLHLVTEGNLPPLTWLVLDLDVNLKVVFGGGKNFKKDNIKLIRLPYRHFEGDD